MLLAKSLDLQGVQALFMGYAVNMKMGRLLNFLLIET